MGKLKEHWERSLVRAFGKYNGRAKNHVLKEVNRLQNRKLNIVVSVPPAIIAKLRAQQKKMFPPSTGPRAAPTTGHTLPSGSDSLQPLLGASSEHSLCSELTLPLHSPCTLNMYEGELADSKQPLLSPCSSGVGESVSSPSAESANCATFDLNPQFEQSSDIWNILSIIDSEKENPMQEIDCLRPSLMDLDMDSASQSLFNVEDVLLDKKDMMRGPTLAQLNGEAGSSDMFDDIPLGSNLLPGNPSETFARPVKPPVVSSPSAALPSPVATLPSVSVCNTTCVMTTASLSQLNPSVQPQAVVAPSGVQYLAFPSAKAMSQPFPGAVGLPPLVPPSAQIISANPCLNQLLVPAKSEPVCTITSAPQPLEASPPVALGTLIPVTPPKDPSTNAVVKGIKRSLSPNGDSNSSFETKWRDIKDLLDESQGQVFVPDKKIKTEVEDVAFNPPEETGSSCHNVVEDEGFDSGGERDDDQSDHDGMSDGEDLSDVEPSSSFIEEFISSGRKEKRFFWQYNMQSKGPKGKRLAKALENNDPHILHDFEDPVFDPELQDMKYKHNGKARRGDGNDITPNPYRLFQIGNELSKLNKHINSIAPVVEMPQGARNRKRKEKNKYASRACRLKKKAQHEANKLKLYGLDQEHVQLMKVLDMIKTEVKAKLDGVSTNESLCHKMDSLIRKHLTFGMVAGNTADFVNSVLTKVAKGDKTGGITCSD